MALSQHDDRAPAVAEAVAEIVPDEERCAPRSPGIVLLVKMTGDYSLVLPLLAACLTAYGVADFLGDRPEIHLGARAAPISCWDLADWAARSCCRARFVRRNRPRRTGSPLEARGREKASSSTVGGQ